MRYFNPRPREEGDILFISAERNSFYFNPRPREEGDLSVKASSQISIYFNPRPREEGDFAVYQSKQGLFDISIHALVKRATRFLLLEAGKRVISIHALVKRATANLYNDYLYFEAKYHILDIFPQYNH